MTDGRTDEGAIQNISQNMSEPMNKINKIQSVNEMNQSVRFRLKMVMGDGCIVCAL